MKTKGYYVFNRAETGSRIQLFRKGMHLSQMGLASVLAEKGIEVSVNSIGKWERGEVEISIEYAEALSEIFGCNLHGLVDVRLRGRDDDGDQPVPFFNILRRRLRVSAFFCKYQPPVYFLLRPPLLFYYHSPAHDREPSRRDG